MLEYPAIGAKSDVLLEENMIFSLHPQVVDKDGKVCLYTQDTYRIGKTEGECLADVPWKFLQTETRHRKLKRRTEDGQTMKVCVVGCGAVGASCRAPGQRGEVEVWAYDLWKEHTEAIRKNGLRLSGAADFTARLNATSDAERTSTLRLRYRRHQGDPYPEGIAQVAISSTTNSAVCSVQNGVGNEELIADHVKYVIRGTTFPAGHRSPWGISASILRAIPGSARSSQPRRPCQMVEELAGFITRSGMNVIR